MSNYAIGDLQGCYEELRQLLTRIDFDKKKDVLWFCGDLVNRGSNSLNCLLYLHSIKDNCRIVLGNHDLHLIAVSDSIREINLQGEVSAIGGLELKILGGIKAGVKTFIYPEENIKDYNKFVEKYKDKDVYDDSITFIPTNDINDVLKLVFV